MEAFNGKRTYLQKNDRNPKRAYIYTEGFDRRESTELAIDNRKFLRNRLYEKQPISQDAD